MRYHRALAAERVRSMPWKTQVGMVASELSRAGQLFAQDGHSGPEIESCLNRARELLGVLESTSAAPLEAAGVLRQVSYELSSPRLSGCPPKAADLYSMLMNCTAD